MNQQQQTNYVNEELPPDVGDVPSLEDQNVVADPAPISASAKKIRTVNVPTETEAAPSCNIIINTGLFLNALKKLIIKCPEC